MVHLRAKNLPEKGTVEEWLFDTDIIKVGDNFAIIKTESGQEVVVKSHLDGAVVKTIKLGSSVKNGSVLANVAVGSKEIAKFKNKSFNSGDEPMNVELEEFEIEAPNLDRLSSAEDELDEVSGAVMYDRNYQANTPFSNGQEIMDTPEKYQKILKRDQEMKEDQNKAATGGVVKDRFAQMRANIAASIKNSPNANNQNLNISDEEKAKLASMSNEEALKEGNLFAKENGTGMSKFRQLIQSRKEKLLEENDFKEVNEEDLHVDAMSKLDEKGRPLIMRNIIANRLEQFNSSGGDPNAIKNEVLATKKNAVKNQKTPEPIAPSKLLMDGESKYIKPEKETGDMYKIDKSKIVNSKVEEGPFARQKASDDGDFGVTYGAYVDDEGMDVDLNEITNSGAYMLPDKKPDTLLNELKQKTDKTYAESKLANLYDSNRRWEIIKSRNDVSEIEKRRKLIEKTGMIDDSHIPKVSETSVGGKQIPDFFLKETIVQRSNGKVEHVKFKDTEEGAKEFKNWLRQNNLYSIYTAAQDDPTMRISDEELNVVTEEKENTIEVKNESPNLNVAAEQAAQQAAQQVAAQQLMQQQMMQQQMMQQAMQQQMMQNPMMPQGQFSNNDLNYLKKEVESLKELLEKKDKLIEAENELRRKHDYESGDKTFSQMMQLMMMQTMMQNQNGHSNEKDDVKKIIQEQLNDFKNSLMGTKRNSKDEDALNYVDTKKENLKDLVTEQNIPYENEKQAASNVLQRESINPTSLPAVKSMILSQNYIPPLTISTEIDMTSILKLKHVLKKTDSSTVYSTILFIAKALSLSLLEYPKINSSYDPENNDVIVKAYHNIGLATETSEGLIVPVLKFVEKLSLKELAIDIHEMTSRLRRGELYNYETSGSTITLANYGNIGAIHATPTIFYPNAAVVGVGKVVKKPVVVENEKLAIKAMMNISLTVDQRIIDNATAGRFLERIKEILEKPELLSVS